MLTLIYAGRKQEQVFMVRSGPTISYRVMVPEPKTFASYSCTDFYSRDKAFASLGKLFDPKGTAKVLAR